LVFQNLQHFFFGNAKEQNQRRNLFDHLTRLIFPFSISEADITNPQKFFSVGKKNFSSRKYQSLFLDFLCLGL
jgi:hypothetical protein